MYKATRELIKARQKHTNYVVEPVKVNKIGGGESNDCFGNSTALNENDDRYKVVSGWIVGPYDNESGGTVIISHFWNFYDGKYVDSTPGITSDYEYVVDVDLAAYGQQNYEELSNLVCSSLWFQDGVFVLVDAIEDSPEFLGMNGELSCEVLFGRSRMLETLQKEKSTWLAMHAA